MEDKSIKEIEVIDCVKITPSYELFDRLDLCVVQLDKNGNIVYINQYLANLLEYKKEEAINLNWFDNFIPQTAKNETKNVFNDFIHESKHQHHINPILSKSKKEKYINWNNINLCGQSNDLVGSLSIGEDITSQIEYIERFKIAEKKLNTIIDGISDVIVVLDKKGVVTYNSPRVIEVLGFTPEELVGKNVFSMIHPEDTKATLNLYETSIKNPGTAEHFKIRFRTKSGEWRKIEGVGRNYLQDPSIQGVLINYRDVTEKEGLIDQFMQQAQELKKINEVMVGRELRMVELKKEIEELRSKQIEFQKQKNEPEK